MRRNRLFALSVWGQVLWVGAVLLTMGCAVERSQGHFDAQDAGLLADYQFDEDSGVELERISLDGRWLGRAPLPLSAVVFGASSFGIWSSRRCRLGELTLGWYVPAPPG